MPLRRLCAALAAVLALLTTASPADAGFVTYSFTSDSSVAGGALAGSFRVDEADLLDGLLSTADVKDYAFTFTASSGAVTHYDFVGVFPDVPVSPLTGLPTGSGDVLGEVISDGSGAQAALTPEALTLNTPHWAASNQATGEIDSGQGHWEIGPAQAAPAPGGAVLGLVGAGCLGLGRLIRRRARGR
jgi:hypothetical protein